MRRAGGSWTMSSGLLVMSTQAAKQPGEDSNRIDQQLDIERIADGALHGRGIDSNLASPFQSLAGRPLHQEPVDLWLCIWRLSTHLDKQLVHGFQALLLTPQLFHDPKADGLTAALIVFGPPLFGIPSRLRGQIVPRAIVPNVSSPVSPVAP